MDENEETLLTVLKEIRDELRLILAISLIQLPAEARERLKRDSFGWDEGGIYEPLFAILKEPLDHPLILRRLHSGLTKREI